MSDNLLTEPGEGGPSCMFKGREGICCSDYDHCDYCGFNPRVEVRRKRKLRERRKADDNSGQASEEE